MTIDSSKTLRLLEVVGNKIQNIVPLDKSLEELTTFGQVTFRIEIVPEDQLQVNYLMINLLYHSKSVCS